MLTIKNLHVGVSGKDILKGLDLNIGPGEVHVIMGPNGAGKSTLAYALAGREGYDVTQGDVLLDGQSLVGMEPEARAAAGLFLAFQYPVEIPGVLWSTFLKTAVNALRKARGQTEIDALGFLKMMKARAEALGISDDMLKRAVNVGFSGGEKKRCEALQLSILEPRLAVLDETDSGLDIDAMKIVAGAVNALRGPQRSFLMITHYQKLLDLIAPDRVHILSGGKIIRSGGPELAQHLEEKGFAGVVA
ncbi:MAG: Fe-S cluster assembly ATPase SufC [Rhodospirillales bacterium]|nr:Fe-S cluster assembly ATPase SufC [Rhodospirillales bacterium]